MKKMKRTYHKNNTYLRRLLAFRKDEKRLNKVEYRQVK